MIIKKCPVIKTNELVTVIKFDDIYVQLPSIHSDVMMVDVAHDDGKYFVVDEMSKKADSGHELSNRLKTKKTSKREIAETKIDDHNDGEAEVVEQDADSQH